MRYFAAIIAGLVWAAAFPKWGVAGFAWIAPALLLFSAAGGSASGAFKWGYIAGAMQSLVSLYWLLLIPFRWHGIPLGPAAGWIALSAYLALYPAIWVWLCWKVFEWIGRDQAPAARFEFAPSGWARRAVWALACAASWVALEMARARLLGGFPWNVLGASQYRIVSLTQIASLTGVYGVSFLAVWFSVSLGCALALLVRRGAERWELLREIILPLFAVTLVAGWGFQRVRALNAAPSPGRELRVALVQPSIPQEMIWQSDQAQARFDKLLLLSAKALEGKPALLVWPEAALPGITRENIQELGKLISGSGAWMIFGADDFEPGPSGKPDDFKAFNAALLINPSGDFHAMYRKRRLVMFGEYLPLSGWLPFLKYLVPIGNFTPGPGPVPFWLTRPSAQTSVLICFEDIFPHHTRAYVRGSTDFLLNLTNDGWFGQSAAQWQQAAAATFRAIENHVPLIRCTNNGITGWIDEKGRWREIFRDPAGSEYAEGYLVATIPLLQPGETRMSTFYRDHGDLFGWSCVGLAGVLVLLTSTGTKRRAVAEDASVG